MKLCLAQYRSTKADIDENIKLHLQYIQAAIEKSADLIIFPELSLSGYEPSLAEELTIEPNDSRLSVFQELSDAHDIIICISVPTVSDIKPKISMIIFRPNESAVVYSKRCLHADETSFFSVGKEAYMIECKGLKIFPAICYESMLTPNAKEAKALGADIYLATVAKDREGIIKGNTHYPKIARQYEMMVMMSNSVGYNDDFVSMGQSAVWDEKGVLLSQMNVTNTGILIIDSDSRKTEIVTIPTSQ